MVSLSEYLLYYRERFEKNSGDEGFLKHAVEKLNPVEVTADAITKTGIYKIVRELAKTPGPWVDIITPLYLKWRAVLVAKQNNSSKPVETEVPPWSQSDVSNNLCNERVKSSATLHTSESPNNFAYKPGVTNGAKYSLKSSHIQENIYFQNKKVRSSENQTNKNIVINNGANFPVKLPDVERNAPWNQEVKPSENHASKTVMNKDANVTAKFSDFEEKGYTWNKGKRPPDKHTNKSMEFRNDPNRFLDFNEDEFFAQWKRRMMSENVSAKGELDKHAYFASDEETGISEFHVANGLPRSVPHPTHLLGKGQNCFKVANNIHPAHNRNIHNFEQNNLDSSTSLNAYNSVNALSPRSSNSQNPADTGVSWTASPNKTGKLPNPYEIEMKEGMFRVVKSDEDVPPAIARVRNMYNPDEVRDGWDYAPKKVKNNSEEIIKPSVRDHSVSKNVKSSKVSSEKKSLERKSHSAKSKNNTPDKLKSNLKRTNSENTACKPVKRKLTLSSDSAIQKSQCEKVIKEANGLPITESHSNSISPKCGRKEDPLSKLINSSSCKERQTVSANNWISSHKSSINENSAKLINSSNNKEGQTAKLDSKRNSPIVVSIRLADYAPFYEEMNKPIHMNGDILRFRNLPYETGETFVSAKEGQPFTFPREKPVQEIPTLRMLCVQMLKKNIETMKSTRNVPYEQLKPVLTHFTATRLRRIEENNPYLLEKSDELWKSFCRKQYRGVKPVPPETWREVYWKTREGRNKKLKNVTANISASTSKSGPERQIAVIESPKPVHKRMRLSEPKSSKEALNHKNSPKESVTSHTKSSKESNSSSHKKKKKGK